VRNAPVPVSLDELRRVLELTDRLGVHREQVVIPLAKGEGSVRRGADGRFQIIVDRGSDFELVLFEIERALRQHLGLEDD
jgi:hypothetical protein